MLICDITIIILKSISIVKQIFLFFKKIHSQFFFALLVNSQCSLLLTCLMLKEPPRPLQLFWLEIWFSVTSDSLEKMFLALCWNQWVMWVNFSFLHAKDTPVPQIRCSFVRFFSCFSPLRCQHEVLV